MIRGKPRKKTKLIIDNADLLLERMFPFHDILNITLTGGERTDD